MKSNHSLAALISLSLAVGPVIALGQEAATASSFDVVSIRQGASDTEKRDGQPEVEVTGDGWRLNDEPLFAAIINAYTPPSGGAAFYTPPADRGPSQLGLGTAICDRREDRRGGHSQVA